MKVLFTVAVSAGLLALAAPAPAEAGDLCWRKVCAKRNAARECTKYTLKSFRLPGALKCAGKPIL